MTLAAELQDSLARSAAARRVPGATAGVLHDGRIELGATGVLNLETDVAVTPDSVFQIGSITKLYTATLVMRLVEQHGLDLDAPVADVLAGFRVADAEVSARVTPRHLLTHTSGIAGDQLADTGRGDDCLQRYVEGIADLGQDVPLGAVMSYSNTGYVILGRLVEVLTGRTFDEALAELLLAPLGANRTVTLPEQALRFRTAWGHVETGSDQPLQAAPVWSAAWRSMGPAGAICASAGDVLRFAEMHLRDGRAADGTRILSPESARAMHQPQVAVPDPWAGGSHWGLGWILDDWEGRATWGHDGSTGGQAARLWVVPDRGLAFVALANGGDVQGLWDDLADEILEARLGVTARPWPAPAPHPLSGEPAAAIAGRYERHGMRIEIAPAADELVATATVIEPLASQLPFELPPSTMVVRAAADGDGVYVARGEGDARWTPMAVVALGGERYLHTGARAQRARGPADPSVPQTAHAGATAPADR